MKCFILRAVRHSNKLLGQGYVKERLRSSLRKFYGRYGDLIKQYEVPLSRMLHDILDNDHLQCHPLLIRHYTNFLLYYWSGHFYRIWHFTKLREVPIEHLQPLRHANRGRLLLRTPGPVQLWDQSLLNLSCFRTFEFRTSLGTSFLLCLKAKRFTNKLRHRDTPGNAWTRHWRIFIVDTDILHVSINMKFPSHKC